MLLSAKYELEACIITKCNDNLAFKVNNSLKIKSGFY